MAKTTGLFGELYDDVRADDRAEEADLMRQAQLGGIDSAKYAGLSGAKMAGEALGSMAVRAGGGDPRSNGERMQAAMKAMSQMPEADMTKPEGVDNYYRGVINILRQQGLAGEAHRAAQEWNAYKDKQTDRQVKIDDLNRKKTDDARKAGIAEDANRIKAERNKQLSQQGLPEFVQLVDRIEKTEDPVTRKRLLDYANAKIESLQKGVTFEDAGDRILVRNKATGAVIGTDLVGEKPMNAKDANKLKSLESAYQAAMLAAQTDYKAAVDLFNHPGLDNLIGKWSGIAAERGTDKDGALREGAIAMLTKDGQDALALFNQVQGGAFVRALSDLKTAGGGSTGLGQVTEVEGQKVTAAKGALFPRQQPESFRRHLKDYISVVEQSSHILGGKAKEDGLNPVDLNIIELTGPIRGRAGVPAPTTPRSSPRAPTDGDRVRVLRPDGQTGTIPRAKLQEYTTKGYKEIK
jgi:hypothetical protein